MQIGYKDKTGTCFTIEVDCKQYLVTAKHVVKGIAESDTIAVFHIDKWKTLNARVVGQGAGEIDVIVLALDAQETPTFPITPDGNGIALGQDSFFLGFPYGLSTPAGQVNGGFPIPFIKKAIVSGLSHTPDQTMLFLDGHNNPGFSGGPVVFVHQGTNELRIAAVVSGYKQEFRPVLHQDQETPLYYSYNTGIVETYSIRHAVELIQQNPIGALLTH